jgi:hypothetical protein
MKQTKRVQLSISRALGIKREKKDRLAMLPSAHEDRFCRGATLLRLDKKDNKRVQYIEPL